MSDGQRRRVAIIGPVFPYRAGIAYCTTRLAEELAKTHEVTIVSFKRQFPRAFYPGGSDVDESLRSKTPAGARFDLDVVNPLSWLRTGRWMREQRFDAVIFVWWIWVWALPYRILLAMLPRSTRVILQCHNIGEKEPAFWKRALANLVLRRGDVLVVHAQSEAEDAARRVPGNRIVKTFLPVHELGGEIPSRHAAKSKLHLHAQNVALFFGHVRPFKGLDIALQAWSQLKSDVTLLVAGEVWWKAEEEYRRLVTLHGQRTTDNGQQPPRVILDFRYIPDSEIATYFAAADVVLAPYRIEAQSGVALTAFHFGRPVIATRVGGLPEVIEEGRNGLLVPPDDPAALARAVDAFFESDRETMERGATESAARYSWKEYGETFRRLVESVS